MTEVFEVFIIIEKFLDFFENPHPALLLNVAAKESEKEKEKVFTVF